VRILDKGYIELLDHMGDEDTIISAARVSVGAKAKAKRSNAELLKFLFESGHTSPFEHVHFRFRVKAPIFVLRQWMRHRTFNYSELSMRYTKSDGDFYVPKSMEVPTNIYRDYMKLGLSVYNYALDRGIPREQARVVLPQSMYSEVIMTVDLNNLIKFLAQREAPEAQKEIQQYAAAMKFLIRPIVPNVIELYEEKRWEDLELKYHKEILKKHSKEEQSLKPQSISESPEQPCQREYKSLESDEEEVGTLEPIDDEGNALWYTSPLSKDLVNDYLEILESCLEY